MSAVAKRTGVVAQRPGLRRIAGSRFEVDNQITEYRSAGRLKAKTRPRPVPGAPHIVEAYVVLSDPPSKTPLKVAVGVAVLLLGAAVWWVVANLSTILAVLAGVLLVLGAVLLVALFSDDCDVTVIHRRR